MATGITGYFDLTGSNSSFTVRVNYSETYDAVANTSALSITSVQVKSSSYYGYSYYPDGIIKINGVTVLTMDSTISTGYVYIEAQGAWYTISNATGSLSNIAHNTDGSKSVTVELAGNRFTGFRFYTTSGSGGSGWYVAGSKTVTLTAIPRASTIGATDANIGATSMIAVSRKSSRYSHSIAYKFGTLSGYITASGGVSTTESKFTKTSIAFTVPTSFYAKIPNAKAGTCTLTIKTYSGTTQIGAAQTCTFTATAAESNCKPTVSGTVVDSNDTTKALTGNASKLVRYYSTALCTITATAKNSATISRKTIGGVSVSGTTRSIPNVESGRVAFSAKDSRGYSASTTVNATVVPYVKLTNNSSGARTDSTSGNAILTIKGNYYNGSFGAVNNTLEVKYRIGSGGYVAVSPTINGNTYSASVPLSGLDYMHAYTVDIVATDKLASISKRIIIGKGIPVFDWGESGMAIHVPLTVDDWPVSRCKLLLTQSRGWGSGASVKIPELANCDAALVFYCNGIGWDTTALRHVIVPVGTIGVLESVVNFTAAAYLTMVQRQITVASNGTVTAGEVWLKPVNSNTAAEDNTKYPYACSPYKIYGLKWNFTD